MMIHRKIAQYNNCINGTKKPIIIGNEHIIMAKILLEPFKGVGISSRLLVEEEE